MSRITDLTRVSLIIFTPRLHFTHFYFLRKKSFLKNMLFKPFFKHEKSRQVSDNTIHMIEFAINVYSSPDTLSESIRNLIMVLYKPSWWFYIMLTFASIFKDLMLKSASLTQILYWSHVEYSTWPDMSIFEKYGSRAF